MKCKSPKCSNEVHDFLYCPTCRERKKQNVNRSRGNAKTYQVVKTATKEPTPAIDINPELLAQRMMRGACRGPVAIEETTPMSRCKGKLENGTRCKIVAAPGKDRCSKCEARGGALYDKTVSAPPVEPSKARELADKEQAKRGRPAKKGQLSEAEQELQGTAAIPALCDTCAGKDTCDGFGTGYKLTECAAYCPEEESVPVRRLTNAAQNDRDDFEATFSDRGCSCHITPPCSYCLHPGNPASQEEDESAWTTEPEESGSVNENHFSHAGNMVSKDHTEDERGMVETGLPDVKFRELSDSEYADAVLSGSTLLQELPWKVSNLQILPVEAEPGKEAATPCADLETPQESYETEDIRPRRKPGTGLSALIRRPRPIPAGLFIPFAQEELAALAESEVTPEIIREFVIMGLEGKVQAAQEVRDDGR